MREQTPGPSLRHEKGHTLVLVLLFLSEFWDPFGRLVLWFMFQTVVSDHCLSGPVSTPHT